jgi:stage II sporulation protein M
MNVVQAILRQEHIDFLGELRPYIKLSVLLLAVGIILGGLSGAQVLNFGAGLRESFRALVEMFAGLPIPLLAVALFVNNSLTVFIAMVLGVIGGVVPIWSLLLNGYAIGWVGYLSVQAKGMLPSLLAIAPHGIFEIPAFLLGTSIGIFLGVRAIRRVFGQSEISLRNDLGRSLRFFGRVILPLLVVAAVIEAFVTATIVAR